MNRPKNIGTAAESAVVRWARAHGYPEARRLALAGVGDIGDVELTRQVMLQIKAGHAAEKASDTQVAWWLAATGEQALRGGYEQWFLVTKRAGQGRPERWWVHTRIGPVHTRFVLADLPTYTLLAAL